MGRVDPTCDLGKILQATPLPVCDPEKFVSQGLESPSSISVLQGLWRVVVGVSVAGAAGMLAVGWSGTVFWGGVSICLLAAIWSGGHLVRLVFTVLDREFSWVPFHKLIVVIGATMATIAAAEWAINLLDRANKGVAAVSGEVSRVMHDVSWRSEIIGIDRVLSPDAIERVDRREGVLTLPREWERREVPMPAPYLAEVWHGVTHVYDSHRFRRTAPFSPKQNGVFRVAVLGDSLTYGYGVEERFTYPMLLQQALEKEFRVEVLPLGNNNAQSEDILRNMQVFVPMLQPDLVVYGVVLNDFLPSKKGQYTCRVVPFRALGKLEEFFSARSRLASLVRDRYEAALRMVGACADFFDDILNDFGRYQERFGRDVAEMNRVVTELGRPPIVAMVLDQFPEYGGRGHMIARAAEQHLRQAGIDVIEIEDYYRRLNGRKFPVSPWEGHPNEEGHAIFAALMLPRLESHPALAPYRRVSTPQCHLSC